MIKDERKTDCFAYIRKDGAYMDECSALKSLYCKNGYKCPFYKEKSVAIREKEIADKRAHDMGYDTKTYGGTYKPMK